MMRRTSWIPMALLALATTGCDTQQVPDAAGLRGISDLEQVGRYIFIASSHQSELRVMDTEADPALGRVRPGFIRGPNPIALLSIPVLDRPLALAADVHFDAEGKEIRGPYLYVQGSGAREISVVGAEPEVFREVARLSTSGPVTAITGVGPAAEGGKSTLIYAETIGGAARLFSAQLTDVESVDPAPVSTPLRRLDGTPAYWPGETIAALLTLPRSAAGELRIVAAFRGDSGAAGRTELLTLDSEATVYTQAPVLLDFGRPVRSLRTHAKATRTEGEGDEAVTREILPAGARVFGALDEASCEVVRNCSGIVAVDAMTLDRGELPPLTLGQRSLDRTGQPMVTLQTEGDLLLDFQVLPGFQRVPFVGFNGGVVMDLGGVMTTGNGYYTIFDAAGLSQLNLSEDLPSIIATSVDYVGADGISVGAPLSGTIAQLVSNQTTRLNHGVVRTEVVTLVYRSPIPGLRSLEIGDGGPVERIPGGLVLPDPALIERLRVGDEVQGQGAAGCPETMIVDAFDEVTGEVFTTPEPSDACETVTFAAGEAEQPWVVAGSRSGWLGRAQEGEIFESVAGVPFARTETYEPGAPQMRFNFVLPSSLVPSPGQALRFSTLDGFVPQQGQVRAQSLRGTSVPWPPATSLVLMPASPDYRLGSIWAAIPDYNRVAAFSTNNIAGNTDISPLNVQSFQ